MTSHLQQELINKQWTKLFQTEIKLRMYEQEDVTTQCQYRKELKCVTSSSFYFYFSYMYVTYNAFFTVTYKKQHCFKKPKQAKNGLEIIHFTSHILIR